MVTATTGTAAFNIASITLHSAANFPIGKQTRKKIEYSKGKDWANCYNLIIDEAA